jgi:hypothetical protein
MLKSFKKWVVKYNSIFNFLGIITYIYIGKDFILQSLQNLAIKYNSIL